MISLRQIGVNICYCHTHQCSFSSLASVKINNKLNASKSESVAGKARYSFATRHLSTTTAISGGTDTSVNVNEIEKFEKMSSSWWNNVNGQMKELHSMNRLRVPLIRDGLLQRSGNSMEHDGPISLKPLENFHILDVGCGGGILCEPLGRLGAKVIGIDPGKENIQIAKAHLHGELLQKVTYECTSIEDFVVKDGVQSFDGIVMSEVIEHVDSPENFIRSAVEVLKPGGSLFLTTINRTTESWLGAIVAWEYVLRKLPTGTHDWKKFLTPAEVERLLNSAGLRTVLVHGMCYNPISNSWRWSNQRAINYAIQAVKE